MSALVIVVPKSFEMKVGDSPALQARCSDTQKGSKHSMSWVNRLKCRQSNSPSDPNERATP